MHATFICGGQLVPASRFRVHPIAKALEAEGWEIRVIHGYGVMDQRISGNTTRRAYRLACRFRRAVQTALLQTDGPILVQRLALPWLALPELLLAKRTGRVVFDFDDAVFLGGNGKEHPWRRRALDDIFRHSAHIVAGNSWLAQTVGGNRPVSVIPTCIDTSHYRPNPPRKSGTRPRIGWIGTGGNFLHLKQLVNPLNELRSQGYSFDFVLCSDEIDQALFRALGAEFVKWSAAKELEFLQSLDIGLMPLADNDWCRGKCSFKMIQYMAVGCPVVASAVGMNIDVLRGDVGGRLVSEENWVAPLAALLDSEKHRLACGSDARARAVSRYDLSVAINGYRHILEKLQ